MHAPTCHVNISSALVVIFVCANLWLSSALSHCQEQAKATSDAWIAEQYWRRKNNLNDNAVDYIKLSKGTAIA
jgi:hypothetical protein